jgi:hypothetical protein
MRLCISIVRLILSLRPIGARIHSRATVGLELSSRLILSSIQCNVRSNTSRECRQGQRAVRFHCHANWAARRRAPRPLSPGQLQLRSECAVCIHLRVRFGADEVAARALSLLPFGL